MNLTAIDELQHRFGNLDIIMVESGGDNLSATFSPELSDLTLYVIDVSAANPQSTAASLQEETTQNENLTGGI